jgi:hypothetical protein
MTTSATYPILPPLDASRKPGFGRDTFPSRRLGSQSHLQLSSRQSTKSPQAPTGQSSRYRGVSLLRRTGRWHAQINFDGRQIHLGFYPGEEQAAGAYDRAAIIKWAASARSQGAGPCNRPPLPPTTNFHISRYANELKALGSIKPMQLVAALSEERTRREAMSALANGFGPTTTASATASEGTETLSLLSSAISQDAPTTPSKQAMLSVQLLENAGAEPFQQRTKRRKLASPHASASM